MRLGSRKKRSLDARHPEPAYNLREGEFDGLYAVMIVNEALKGYQFKADFIWHLRVQIDMKEMLPAQLPTQDEAKVLNNLEDEISVALDGVCQKHYVGRTTWNGKRTLFFYLDTPKAAHEVLQTFTSAESPVREFEYDMAEDKDWSRVDFFFDK